MNLRASASCGSAPLGQTPSLATAERLLEAGVGGARELFHHADGSGGGDRVGEQEEDGDGVAARAGHADEGAADEADGDARPVGDGEIAQRGELERGALDGEAEVLVRGD